MRGQDRVFGQAPQEEPQCLPLDVALQGVDAAERERLVQRAPDVDHDRDLTDVREPVVARPDPDPGLTEDDLAAAVEARLAQHEQVLVALAQRVVPHRPVQHERRLAVRPWLAHQGRYLPAGSRIECFEPVSVSRIQRPPFAEERKRAESRTRVGEDDARRRDSPRHAVAEVLHAEVPGVRLVRVGRKPDVALARDGLGWLDARPQVRPRVQFLRGAKLVRLADDDGAQVRYLGVELAVVLQRLPDHGSAPAFGD